MTNYAKEYALYYMTLGYSFEEAYSFIFGKMPRTA